MNMGDYSTDEPPPSESSSDSTNQLETTNDENSCENDECLTSGDSPPTKRCSSYYLPQSIERVIRICSSSSSRCSSNQNNKNRSSCKNDSLRNHQASMDDNEQELSSRPNWTPADRKAVRDRRGRILFYYHPLVKNSGSGSSGEASRSDLMVRSRSAAEFKSCIVVGEPLLLQVELNRKRDETRRRLVVDTEQHRACHVQQSNNEQHRCRAELCQRQCEQLSGMNEQVTSGLPVTEKLSAVNNRCRRGNHLHNALDSIWSSANEAPKIGNNSATDIPDNSSSTSSTAADSCEEEACKKNQVGRSGTAEDFDVDLLNSSRKPVSLSQLFAYLWYLYLNCNSCQLFAYVESVLILCIRWI